MATEAQLIEALKRADEAGNTKDAQQIANVIKTMRSSAANNNKNPANPTPYGLGDAITQGVTFGFADEIGNAGVASLGGGAIGVGRAIKNRDIGEIPRSIGEEYQTLQRNYRAGQEQFREAHPIQAYGGEIAGGAVAGGAGILKNAGGQIGKAALIGAGEGGLYGFGSAQGSVTERVDDAATGAALGAAGGAAFQGVANKVAGFWKARAGKRVADADTKRAFGMLVNSLSDDLGGRNKAEAALRNWMKNGAKPEELFDLGGPVTQNLAREVASRKPTPALQFINSMKDAQSAEIRGAVQKSLNKKGGSVQATRSMLETVRKEQASPLYRQAYAKQIDTEEIAQLIAERPELKKALSKGVSRVLNRGNGVIDDNGMITVEVLDRAKGALDDRINVLMRQGAKREAADIISAKKVLLAKIDELAPEYAEARKVFAGTAEIESALEKGNDFLKPSYSADDLARDLAEMGPSEREFHKVAVAEQFEALIDRTRDRSNKGAFVSTEAMRKKIKTLFADDPQEAEAFIELVKKSEDRFRRLGKIDPDGGSQTEPRQRAKQIFEDAERGPIQRGAETVLENPVAAPGKAVKAAARNLNSKRGQRVSDALSRALFEGADDPFPQATRANVPFRSVSAANPLIQNKE